MTLVERMLVKCTTTIKFPLKDNNCKSFLLSTKVKNGKYDVNPFFINFAGLNKFIFNI